MTQNNSIDEMSESQDFSLSSTEEEDNRYTSHNWTLAKPKPEFPSKNQNIKTPSK